MVRYILLVLVAAFFGMILFGVLRQLFGGGPVMLLSLAILVVVGVVVVRNLGLNRKVIDATPEQRAQALTFAPEAGRAALYVFRTQFIARAVGVNVEIDGRDAAQVKSPRFTRIALAPGAHRVEIYLGTPAKKKPGGSVTELNVSAGEVVVLKCEVEPQMVGTAIKTTRVELDKARADLQKARMVAADVGEV